jgi:hypothetical protein
MAYKKASHVKENTMSLTEKKTAHIHKDWYPNPNIGLVVPHAWFNLKISEVSLIPTKTNKK